MDDVAEVCTSLHIISSNPQLSSNPPASPQPWPTPSLSPSRNDQILDLPDVQPHADIPADYHRPQSLPSSHQRQANIINDLQYSITQTIQEQELGKLMLNIAMAAAVLLSVSDGKSDRDPNYVIPFGLMTGAMAIWNGILFRKTSPPLANVLEQVGTSLVLIMLFGFVASSLPKFFSWILWICAGLTLVPLVVSMLSHLKQPSNSNQLDNPCMVNTS